VAASTPQVPETELPGYPHAIDSIGSVAAPLLAGFSLTFVVYTLTATDAFRWPNLVLCLMVAAALALIGVVQCAAVARLFSAAPPARRGPGGARLLAQHRLWARRAEKLYNGGILLLLSGVAAALVPPEAAAGLGGRLVAIAVAVAGLLGAALWMAAPYRPVSWIVGWIAARLPHAQPAAEEGGPAAAPPPR
jgi:hypothetical protein